MRRSSRRGVTLCRIIVGEKYPVLALLTSIS
jgi:hypothetical protein